MDDFLHIRSATPRDREDIAAIGYVAWEQSLLPMLREAPGMRQAEKRRLMAYAGECWQRIVVAEIDGEVVGWAAFARGRPYIPFLFVVPHMQSRGIGSTLLRRVESLLELRGHEYVHLETLADHVRGVGFYERNGYRILALKNQGPSSHDAMQRVRLEKNLFPYYGEIEE